MKSRLMTGASLAALVAMLAFATTAQAANSITGGTLKVRGYSVTLLASDSGKKDSLNVLFHRKAKKSFQSHSYTFMKGVKVTKNSIKGSLGRYGTINMKLKDLRSVKNKTKLPTGCTGTKSKVKVGVLKGKFKLKADKKFFRTVKAKSLNASLNIGGKIDCSGSGGGMGGSGDGTGGGKADEPILVQTRLINGATHSLTAENGVLSALLSESLTKTSPAVVTHMAMTSAPGALTVTPNATAKVKSFAPFFSGAGDFTPTTVLDGFAMGTLNGNFAARFDGVGTVKFVGDAQLLNFK